MISKYFIETGTKFGNLVSDLNIKCKDCGTINTVTIENGELRKQS